MTTSADGLFHDSAADTGNVSDEPATDRLARVSRSAGSLDRSEGASSTLPEGLPRRLPTVSVVIPTYNRKQVLAKTLAALGRQSLEDNLFEVIVVDDGSSDGTEELVRSYESAYELRYERCKNGGLAAARNRGLALATHDVVVFLDDDVVPERDFLRQHWMEHCRDDRIAVLGSLPFHPDVARSAFLWYLEHVTFFDLFKDEAKYAEGRPPMPPVNGNSSVRRRDLEEQGGYDATFRAYGGEDLDLGYRLQEAGVRFVYNGRAVGYHYHIKGFEAFCRDQERAGYAVARLVEEHPEVRTQKRVDLVVGPMTDLSTGKKLLRIGLHALFRFPLPVWGVRLALRGLGKLYPLRKALVPLYRLGSHYYYAKGIRTYHRELRSRAGADVPLVRS